MQDPNILDKNQEYETRVATNINLTSNIEYALLNFTIINKKGISINKRVLISGL